MDLINKIESLRYDIENGVEKDVINISVRLIQIKDQALQLQPLVSGSLQDIQEIIEFLQWSFRKIDKGDTPEETVRMLLNNRAKIDNIKFDRCYGMDYVKNRR